MMAMRGQSQSQWLCAGVVLGCVVARVGKRVGKRMGRVLELELG
jgi:uncharacterized protein (DUF3084 family)